MSGWNRAPQIPMNLRLATVHENARSTLACGVDAEDGRIRLSSNLADHQSAAEDESPIPRGGTHGNTPREARMFMINNPLIPATPECY